MHWLITSFILFIMVSPIARRYAVAAFESACKADDNKELKTAKKICEDLENFCKILSENIIKELSNPAISKDYLLKVIEEFTSKIKVHKYSASLISLVVLSRKVKIIPEIYNYFEFLYKKAENIIEIAVISASKLSSGEISKVNTLAQKKFPKKKIEIIEKIKPEILGGIILDFGNEVMDASLKTQLNNLEQNLKTIL